MMVASHRHALTVLAAAAVLVLAAPATAPADMPSSMSYRLDRYAFTGGRGNTVAPSASTEWRMEACSVGGISADPTVGVDYTVRAGYLVDWLWAGQTPEIVEIWTAGGRLYLAWTPVVNAAGYRVESAPDRFSVFAEDLTGIYAGETWNCPVPAVESMFYRVAATESP